MKIFFIGDKGLFRKLSNKIYMGYFGRECFKMIDIFFLIYRVEEVELKLLDCNGEDKLFFMMLKLEW